ncbi:hypothetical protein [Dyella choica]|uniref:Uncharacterized protein n=1 Tax=Dyella choica TaxID=1927959 RepID=A0A3S0RIM4_9GAMM|nr:hypothetical protein [Dyella choica]RUL72417.1 hypothetical protein EKH80_17155 [Dyella choica]
MSTKKSRKRRARALSSLEGGLLAVIGVVIGLPAVRNQIPVSVNGTGKKEFAPELSQRFSIKNHQYIRKLAYCSDA